MTSFIKEIVPAGLLLVCGLGTSGCRTAADKHAQSLARVTLSQAVEYQGRLQDMERVLGSSYKADLDTLVAAIQKTAETSQSSESLRLGDDLADLALIRPISSSTFRAFVQASLKSDRDLMADAASKVADLEQKRSAKLEGILAQQEAAKEARAKLERLQSPPDLSDEIARYRPLFEAGRDAIKAANEKSKPQH